MSDRTTIIARLSQPLDMARIKRRQAPGEGSVCFLEGHDVISTANQIFGYCWSFDLLSEPRVMIWEQAVTKWDRQKRERVPVLDPESGQPRTHRAGMVYLTGKVTVELDGKAYTHADVGRVSFTGDTPEALDTALSGAATDCLKRCFRQLGDQFGLGLYAKEPAKAVGAVANAKTGNGARSNRKNGSTRLLQKSGGGNGQSGMTTEQALLVLCPVGSTRNPQWAGMPLGEVLAQPNGERMLAYLADEQFIDNNDPARAQARLAATVLLGQIQPQGV